MVKKDGLIERTLDHVNMIECVQKGGSIKITCGEMNPVFYNHILVLLGFLWAVKEKDVKIEIMCGPILCVEDKTQELKIQGDALFLQTVRFWLSPYIEGIGKAESFQLNENGLLIKSTPITINSIADVVSGKICIKKLPTTLNPITRIFSFS